MAHIRVPKAGKERHRNVAVRASTYRRLQKISKRTGQPMRAIVAMLVEKAR